MRRTSAVRRQVATMGHEARERERQETTQARVWAAAPVSHLPRTQQTRVCSRTPPQRCAHVSKLLENVPSRSAVFSESTFSKLIFWMASQLWVPLNLKHVCHRLRWMVAVTLTVKLVPGMGATAVTGLLVSTLGARAGTGAGG